MASAKEASVASWKRELVGDLQEKFEEYPVVGVLDIQGIPAPQFQEMREKLRGKAEIKVSRRVLLRIAIEKRAESEPEIGDLADHLEGPSALIFTEMNPFKLWKFLSQNRTSAPAKLGMESPRDIVIPEGETDFSPGPIIGELQQAGVNARIQAGSVVVLEDSTIAEEGKVITEDEVSVMARFGIEPREIGFELMGAYADGAVFSGDMLEVDEEEVLSDIKNAYVNSLRLSYGISFPTRQNLPSLLSQAHSRGMNLALNALVLTSESAPQLLSKASTEMLSLASTLAAENPDVLDEELESMISTQTSIEKTKKEEEKPKEEESKEEVEEEEKEEAEEEEDEAGLGGLFE